VHWVWVAVKVFGVKLTGHEEQSLQIFEQSSRADYLEGAARSTRTHIRVMLKELTDE
jgi:hypothetical protein